MSEIALLAKDISVSNFIGFKLCEIPVTIAAQQRIHSGRGLCVNVKYEWPYFEHMCICILHRTLMHLQINVVTEVCVFVVSKVK